MIVDNAEAMRALGERLGRELRAGDVVVLTGPLGAGKTTLTQGIAAGLDVTGDVTSPTFVVARRHRPGGRGLTLTHADVFRLGDGASVADLDVDDLGEGVLVVEWGEALARQLGGEWLHVLIERGNEGDDDPAGGPRTVRLEPHGVDIGQRFAGWPR